MLAIGCDKAGYPLKTKLIEYFEKNNIEYKDFGCKEDQNLDYTDIAIPLAESVAAGVHEYGILICGTGIGMSIIANKVPGIFASLCSEEYSARMTKKHNNSNILCLGARVIGYELGKSITQAWLESQFEGGRHQRRMDAVSDYENNKK